MAQPKFKADVITPQASETFIRAAADADTPHSSPARMLQGSIASAFDSQPAKWSARRSLALMVGFNAVAWSLIATAASRFIA